MGVNKQGGMTLIEIMVVVVIIGMLATIVGPSVMGVLGKAQGEVVQSDFKAIETALKMYKLHNHIYPTEEQGLDALVSMPESDPKPKNWAKEGYLPKIPMDPWGNAYLYEAPADNGKPYDIYTLGADGVRGGQDESADISMHDEAGGDS